MYVLPKNDLIIRVGGGGGEGVISVGDLITQACARAPSGSITRATALACFAPSTVKPTTSTMRA